MKMTIIKSTFCIIFPIYCYADNLSIYDSYEKLFESENIHIHPTTHITNLIRNDISSFSDEKKENLEKLGLFEKNGILKATAPDFLDMTYETNHFRIHYTTNESSSHKVDNLDYVIQMGEVFEQVWMFFIDTLEFNSPIFDDGEEPFLYNVYIENLPSFYFGITYTSNNSSNLNQCSSFIKMRNNYDGSQFSAHTELENIKVTAVHEFFHSIQFSYNCFERLWIMEASAVWSEDQLYNGVNDHYRYLNSWFQNIHLPIDHESNHMYGSFIFFQYLDEHFGDTETIKKIWDYSKEYASSSKDISFQSIDLALEPNQINFKDAYHKMAISNKILSDLAQPPFSYVEANGYKTVTDGPANKQDIIFERGNNKQINNQSIQKYSTYYYSLSTNSPVKINFIKNSGNFSFSIIIKHLGKSEWLIKSDPIINIDPNIGIEWISIVVSALESDTNNWDFTIELENGFSEDFILSLPFPNPSYGNIVNFNLEIYESQNISFLINDIIGNSVWEINREFIGPGIVPFSWYGMNTRGNKVSNGIYFLTAKGKSSKQTQKLILLKN